MKNTRNDQTTDNCLVISIEIANEQSQVPLDDGRLREAVRTVLENEGVASAQISLAVVDDPIICRLHRKYLQVDGPTDVLSFVLERDADHLDGEVVVSAETAERESTRFGWTVEDELLLYVVHGTLHLVGYDDMAPEKRAEMRRLERAYLACLGVEENTSELPGTSPETITKEEQRAS